MSSAKKTKSRDADEKLVPSLTKWDPTNWTPQMIHNSMAFRIAAVVGVGAMVSQNSASSVLFLSLKTSALIHLFSFATWFGTVMYTTFVLGMTMYKNLPRRTFGTLQSKLFPKFFALCSLTIALQLLTLSALNIDTKTSQLVMGMAFVMTLLNVVWLEPQSTKIMFARYELEDKEGGTGTAEYNKLKKDFAIYHGLSSLTNLIALCGGIAHGFYLTEALVA